MALPPGPRAPSVVNTLRFVRAPLGMLERWSKRYGDVFAVKIVGFGRGVYIADPHAIKELFTGDQSDLLAGQANSFLAPIIAYCRIGERSAHTWFVLHELLGRDDVRNYDGSWTEWGNLVDVPIEKDI